MFAAELFNSQSDRWTGRRIRAAVAGTMLLGVALLGPGASALNDPEPERTTIQIAYEWQKSEQPDRTRTRNKVREEEHIRVIAQPIPQGGAPPLPPEPVRVNVLLDDASRAFVVEWNGQRITAPNWISLEKDIRAIIPNKSVQYFDRQGRLLHTAPRVMMGVMLESVQGALASQLRLVDGKAILITDVVPGLPAERSGLRMHDIITACNELSPITKSQFSSMIESSEPGDVLNCVIIRSGMKTELEIKLSAYDPEIAHSANAGPDIKQLVELYSDGALNELEMMNFSSLENNFLFGNPESGVMAFGAGNAPRVQIQQHTVSVDLDDLSSNVRDINARLENIEAALEVLLRKEFPEWTGERP